MLEDWLFDTTAGSERRTDEARFAHGHLLKPGDVARTDWRLRCAQPPYDRLPVPRARIPAGVVLSREGDKWIQESKIRNVALPLYEGRMIDQFDFSQKGWVSGKGRSAIWREISWKCKQIEPQYLMYSTDFDSTVDSISPKVLHMRVTSSTNSRTAIGSFVYGMPAGDTAVSFRTENLWDALALTAILNSIVFDFITRTRLTGLHLDYHVMEQNPLPVIRRCRFYRALVETSARLCTNSPWFSMQKLQLNRWNRNSLKLSSDGFSDAERSRFLAVLNALVVDTYRLSCTDLRRIIDGCDMPTGDRKEFNELKPKGFWRVDRDKDPELRHTVLTLIAFHDLQAKIEAAGGDRGQGIEAFLAQNDGEGWMLPETLRLADHGLGHDERARHPQPVAGRLGPRFHDWQLARSTEESRRECHLHARNLLGAHDYARLLAEVIERHAADSAAAGDGDDCLGLLTDPFTRALTGEDGYVTVLLEVRARNLLDETAWWTTVDDLRTGGHLAADRYGQLLDSLHARGLLDGLGYRRRRGHYPPAPSHEPLPRVAEPEAEYHRDAPPKDGQTDLFE